MPIRAELRWYYPIDWKLISRRIRFERARGCCEACGRPHGGVLLQLSDGRWWDEAARTWRDDGGRPAPWPDVLDYAAVRRRRFHLGTAHLDHNPQNSAFCNLRALCQRCHLRHDRPEHVRRRRTNRHRQLALGDLFQGTYRHP
jgi:hypothetical protein